MLISLNSTSTESEGRKRKEQELPMQTTKEIDKD